MQAGFVCTDEQRRFPGMSDYHQRKTRIFPLHHSTGSKSDCEVFCGLPFLDTVSLMQ
jgi:hypothetical protein